ncbi:TetR family transcriptional regulator [Panacagrimonas perspica]|uniref:TetR family transcriptional regulator n=1 Tax=Panacagrimonas perspica TaxID=381431 RepID=A0A4R7NRM4_9GAMM|nr:TetR/AcrR family transcriptional regulator [Panacagrimonas perspica]TDU23342.1 TetR family transcriptional regulator [Panacagrimonas perspica]
MAKSPPTSRPKPASKRAKTASVSSKAPKAAAPASRKSPMRDQVMAFKREQILTEASELFYEHGYQRTTLDMVAQRLGVTKPFIYYHFKDKAAILSEISKRGISRGNEVLRQSLDGKGRAADRLYEAIKAIVRTILNSQRYTAIFFREQKNFDAEILAPLETMHREFDALLSRLLEEGVAKGEFRIADIRLCALAIGGMVNWAYTWYRESGRLSADDLCDGLARLALQMVGAPRA